MTTIPVEYDMAHRRCVVGAEPMIFHCHHYNTFLQRSIQDAESIDSASFLIGAAEEVAFHQLSTLFRLPEYRTTSTRKAIASEIYKWAGFGTFDLSALSEDGGTISTHNSHYAMGWVSKFGKASAPICYFAAGWLAGTLAAIYDRNSGSYSVEQTACVAVSESGPCSFSLKLGRPNYSIYESVGVGTLRDHNIRPTPANHVDYEGILAAVATLPLVGNDEGAIPAFNVYLTRQYSNYYNRCSFELERKLFEKFGKDGRAEAAPLLVEAGHVCAFNTFGGVMTSPEWDALIRPNLKSREDWVHGMLAVVNAFGWGRWQVTKLSEGEAEFVIHDDYESVGYIAMYGKSDHPVSYLAEGGVTGLMNLVYLSDIESKPPITDVFYNRLFKSGNTYRTEVISSRAMGDEVSSFRVIHP